MYGGLLSVILIRCIARPCESQYRLASPIDAPAKLSSPLRASACRVIRYVLNPMGRTPELAAHPLSSETLQATAKMFIVLFILPPLGVRESPLPRVPIVLDMEMPILGSRSTLRLVAHGTLATVTLEEPTLFDYRALRKCRTILEPIRPLFFQCEGENAVTWVGACMSMTALQITSLRRTRRER